MNILLINSSGRTGGNTGRVMSLFEDTLSTLSRECGLAIETERVDLARLSLLPCTGCRACFDLGENRCPRRDGLLALRDQLLKADGLLIASPVYVEDVNGIMKTFIDRMAFLSHRPALYGKSALFFVTSGIGASNHALDTMAAAFGTWGVKAVRRMKFRLGALTAPKEIQMRYEKTISNGARKLIASLTQQPFRPSAYSLIAFSVQQSCWRKARDLRGSHDYRYWSDAGWLERGRLYYDVSMARSLRTLLLHGLGKIIGLFFA